jgi:N-glycosylase/DNA lyase
MSGNVPTLLRRSSRLKTSPYFNGVASQAARTSPYFAVVGSGHVASAFDAPLTPNRASAKRKKNDITTVQSPSSKKQKSHGTIERTQSFEPAWWGNVLVERSQSTLASKNSNEPGDIPAKANYPPVHTLILGTHPSIASLSKNEFYGHPLNAFWYLVGDSLGFRRNEAVSPTTNKPYANFYHHLRYGTDKIIEYDQQLEVLVSRGFALWDIVQECERKGSLDADINMETPNSIREFCEARGSVKRIVIANGTTGGKFFVKHFKDWFTAGGVVAAQDEMSQKCFKAVTNSAVKKAAGRKVSDEKNEQVIEVVCLPSVSPAAAKFTYTEKREVWDMSCFEPGLVDYEKWKNQINTQDSASPKKLIEVGSKYVVTPSPPRKSEKKPQPKAKSTSSSQKSSSSVKAPGVTFSSADIAKLTSNSWVDLQVTPEELRPSATLTNGQCFNWMVVETDDENTATKYSAWGTHDATEWIGPIGDRVLSIKETPSTTMYRVLHGPPEGATEDLRVSNSRIVPWLIIYDDERSFTTILFHFVEQKYFRLETPLKPLYKEWSEADERLSKIAAVIPGCRILRQDPVECMFSFICSSNNNIPRITKMLTSFRKDYGKFLMSIPTQSGEDYAIYSFPTLESLSSMTEDDLRAIGLGYRAKYMVETRDLLIKCGGRDYLLNLRAESDPQKVQDELVQFSGVGRKVADCIALFSLDSDDAIPVDVHVQHIASRDYDPNVLGKAKSITPTIYKQVGDLFRSRFPNRAGWAHSLLFVAELPSFRGVLPSDIVQQMDEVSFS